MSRISGARALWWVAGAALLVAVLAISAGRLPVLATTVAQGRAAADMTGGGLRIVPPPASPPADSLSPDEHDGMSQTDLEGDEVSPAVATYGIDREGNLFEVHSPQTEVPRLPGPTI